MIDTLLLAVFIAAVLLFLLLVWLQRQKNRKAVSVPLFDEGKELLQQHVPFYRKLDEHNKQLFESRVQQFIANTKITGVKTEVTSLDRILVGASAVIPIFAFPDWEYNNVNEVLLYPETFNEEFDLKGNDRSILGMVGNGPMQNVMILSQHELRQGFLNQTGKNNTAIHEFVHLLDKTDGAIDGIPENLLPENVITPWVRLMHRKIQEIQRGKSDIDPYGATNEAEFFAVVSEYFFERPDLLEQKHPELFQLLNQIFKRTEVSQ